MKMHFHGNCTSWRQPGSNQTCTTAANALPGSPSKCNCDEEFQIDVFVEEPTGSLTKTAVQAIVTYQVTVTNAAGMTLDLFLNSLTDNKAGGTAALPPYTIMLWARPAASRQVHLV